MVATGAAPFVDCGPGATLAGLLKRIAPQASVIRLDE
jgi:malonyl CoA-acyl carrier protein transacylase